MKKLITLFLAIGIFGAMFFSAVPATAINVLDPICTDDVRNKATACRDNLRQDKDGNKIYGWYGVLTKIAKLIAYVVGVVSVIMIIIGGFKYVTASGDPNNIKSAKDTILFAIVGILVAVTAQSIVVFVLQRLR